MNKNERLMEHTKSPKILSKIAKVNVLNEIGGELGLRRRSRPSHRVGVVEVRARTVSPLISQYFGPFCSIGVLGAGRYWRVICYVNACDNAPWNRERAHRIKKVLARP